MKVKLEAGAEFDFLTKDELRKVLADWMVETVKGARPVRFSGMATIDAAHTVQLGGSSSSDPTGTWGPDAGFVWTVRRLAVRGINPSAESLSLYINNESPLSLVRDTITGYVDFSTSELIVQGPEKLLLVGNSLNSTGNVFVSGAAIEFPIGLAWQRL